MTHPVKCRMWVDTVLLEVNLPPSCELITDIHLDNYHNSVVNIFQILLEEFARTFL